MPATPRSLNLTCVFGKASSEPAIRSQNERNEIDLETLDENIENAPTISHLAIRRSKSLKLKPIVGKTKKIFLDQAVGHIKNTCSRENSHNPLFFVVGAGISHPPVPLSDQIIKECKKQAGGTHGESDEPSPMEQYSFWLENTYHSPQDRARYFRTLIEGEFVPNAVLRLAHLLSSKRVSNIVATPNFDDFISRSLTMFGAPHIVCDHPATASRIDPESNDLQILHVHGSYWFYDCRNLAGEIEDRAEHSAATTDTMAGCLDRLLSRRSPLVVGYSGWEKDVFMTALLRRLASDLGYNVYWFCYRPSEIESLPPELKEHPNVFFVVPTPGQTKESDAQEGGSSADEAQPFGLNMTKKLGESGASSEATLPATDVFEALAGALDLDDLPLTKDPLRFFADQLRASMPPNDDSSRDDGIYSMSRVIRRVELAADKLDEITQGTEKQLEAVFVAVRTSRFRAAIEAAAEILLPDVDVEQIRRLIGQLVYAVEHLSKDRDNREVVLRGHELVDRAGEHLLKESPANSISRIHVAESAFAAASALFDLEYREEAVNVYDKVVARFGGAEELTLREPVACALVNKIVTLGRLGRPKAALVACEQMVALFGNAEEPILREAVARALFNKGVVLGQMKRRDEAVSAYEHVVARVGDAEDSTLQEQAALALVNKGVTLDPLERFEEALATYEEIVRRFAGAEEATLRDLVALALVFKGAALVRLERREEALVAYEKVLTRFRGAEEATLRLQVARAMFYKGVTLGQLERPEEAVAAYGELLTQFAGAQEAILKQLVAGALVDMGAELGELKRPVESLAAYEEVVPRFGDAEEAPVREAVAGALNGRACSFLYDAKRLWKDGDERRALELLGRAEQAAREACDKAPELAIALGTQGYILFLLGQKERARGVFTKAIALDGESIREAGLKDADTHSLPQDEEFREWIQSIDAEVQ